MMQIIKYNNTDITAEFNAGRWAHPVTGVKYPRDWDASTIEGVTVETLPEPEPTPPQPTYKTQFLPLEFLSKFTEQEQIAVVQATLSSAQLKLWYDKMLAASFIDLSDPRTVGGLTALVSFGLLTEARKNEILTPELME